MRFEKDFLSNIWKLYWIKAVRSALFMMPIITLFFQERGLSMAEIMLLQSIYSITIVLLEIPSGYLSDIFSRKTIIATSLLFAGLGEIYYGFAYGFSQMLVAEMLIALADAFLSGADSAMLYDSLKAAQKENEHKKYASFIFSIERVSEAGAALVGGFLAAWSMASTFFLTGALSLLAIPLAVSLKEPAREKISKHSNHFKELLEIIKFALHSNKKVRWLIIYGSALSASTLVAVWMLQPYFKLVGIPIAYFGLLWSAFNLSGAFFALFAHPLEEKLGLKKSLIFLVILPTLAHFTLGFWASLWTIGFIFAYSATRALSYPILQDYANKEVESKTRASVLSVYNLFSRFAFVTFSPFIGYIADVYSLQTAFLSSGIIFGSIGFLSLPFLLNAHKN